MPANTIKILQYRITACILVLCGFLISCEPEGAFIGKYNAEGKMLQGVPDQVIELREKGHGIWRTGDEETSFTWNVKKDEIRLHLKLGGVIRGKINKDAMTVILPGPKTMVFKRDRLHH